MFKGSRKSKRHLCIRYFAGDIETIPKVDDIEYLIEEEGEW